MEPIQVVRHRGPTTGEDPRHAERWRGRQRRLERVGGGRPPQRRQQLETDLYRQSVAMTNAAAIPPIPMRMFQLPSASMKGM